VSRKLCLWLFAGSSKKGAVAPEDVLTVRECGQKVVETYREKAMKVRDCIAALLCC